MDVKNKNVVVTGAGNGIGRALACCFAQAGAYVICADIDGAAADRVAEEVSGRSFQVDVSRESEIASMIETVEADVPVDLFCSNAGILTLGGVDASNQDWQRTWEVNVMSQVWAARHMVPRMIARGGGYILKHRLCSRPAEPDRGCPIWRDKTRFGRAFRMAGVYTW